MIMKKFINFIVFLLIFFPGYPQEDCLAPESLGKTRQIVYDDQVDVLIIGGGIAGLSSAILFAEQGVKRILVLE